MDSGMTGLIMLIAAGISVLLALKIWLIVRWLKKKANEDQQKQEK